MAKFSETQNLCEAFMSEPAQPESNPLLESFDLPYGAPPLDKVKPEHFLPALKVAMEEAKAQVADIRNNPVAPTFANTIEALELSGQHLSRVARIFGNLAGANSSDALRAIEKDVSIAQVKHGSDIMMDAALFARVKAVHDNRANLALSAEQAMLLENTYKAFVRSGALLDDAKKAELRTLNERLAELSTSFKNNLMKGTAAYQKLIDDEAELAGIPERAKAAYAHNAAEAGHPGKWLIRLSPPPLDVFEYAENRALREEIYRARADVGFGGAFDNRPVILELVELRQKKAGLLGYPDFASFVLSERMAKDSRTVIEFLERNESVYRPAAEEFLKKVQDFAAKTDGLAEVKPWDMFYYSRRLKEETYQLNLEDIRPYFDLEKVLDGLRKHAENLFNIELTETKNKYPVYHEDVKVYEVKDKQTGDMIGLFYADYYARPGAKSNGAWMNTFRNRGLSDTGENEFALVANTCNFAKPTPGHPTLLSLDEVRTVFHEFGHGLHALLAKGDYRSLTGTNVKWDFVELPSQLQENWARRKEVLDTFARHHDTGAPLPAALVQKIRDMENFDAGYAGLRQTFLGLLDMTWHTADPKTIGSVEKLEDGVIAKSWIFPREAGSQSTGFGHLFSGGYAAGYYSYKWAEALEADVFAQFESRGLYDRATADRLRATIYSKGGTEDPEDIFFAMMGRKLDASALFRREGLLGPANDDAPAKPAAPKVPPRKLG
jgi:peptidyl-dipeptidase Dcp